MHASLMKWNKPMKNSHAQGHLKGNMRRKKWISLSFREGQLWILIKGCHLSVVDGMCYTEMWLDGLCPLLQWFLPQSFL